MSALWFQVSLRQPRPGGYAEWVVWRKGLKVGDNEDGWTVHAVYQPGFPDCPHCGTRLLYHDSKGHMQFKGSCIFPDTRR